MVRVAPLLLAAWLLLLPPGAVGGEVQPQAGQLLISELMFRPMAQAKGEGGLAGAWFEIWNPGPWTLALDSLVVRDAEGRAFQGWPFAEATLPAGAYAVLAQSKGARPDLEASGDYYYYGESLAIEADGGSLELYLEGALQDRVSWGQEAWPLCPAGQSLSLEPSGGDPLGNDVPSSWCVEPKPNPGVEGAFCDHDGDGFSEAGGDCDDLEPTVGPGNFEECNGVDDDCSGEIDDLGDEVPPYLCLTSGLCLGSKASCQGKVGWVCLYPSGFEAEEWSCDGADNDCDGFTDEDLRNDCGGCLGALDLCDGVDDDCDGETDEDEAAPALEAFCGVTDRGVCTGLGPLCGSYGWYCPNIPLFQKEESLCDGLDNDCDGDTDEGFQVGSPCTAGEGSCRRAGVLECSPGGAGTHCVVETAPGALELCGNQLDDDCDGHTDEGFQAGQSCTVGVGVCRTTGKWICTQDALGEICSAQPTFPSSEICSNGLDDDCDSYTDEASCVGEAEASAASCGVGGGQPGVPFWPALGLGLLLLGLRRRRPSVL